VAEASGRCPPYAENRGEFDVQAYVEIRCRGRLGSNAGWLAGLAEPLELLAATSLAGLLVIGLPTHLLAEAATLAELAEAADRLLDRLARPDP
jgi:hypothetical protein